MPFAPKRPEPPGTMAPMSQGEKVSGYVYPPRKPSGNFIFGMKLTWTQIVVLSALAIALMALNWSIHR